MENCPTCGDEFKNSKGVKIHHKQVHGESIAGTKHVCEVCGDTFTSASKERKYCSRKCFGKAHSEKMSGESHPLWDRVELSCEWCGNTHTQPQCKSDRPYCSAECAGKARMSDMDPEDNPFYEGGKRETVECQHCGEKFEVFECLNRRFCSTSCFDKWQVESGHLRGENNPQWEGGEYPYGEGWNYQKKERVRERDGRECQHCGRSEEEHLAKHGTKHTVHHIQPARQFDDPEDRNSMDNLITLCKGKCHHKWEKLAPLRPVV